MSSDGTPLEDQARVDLSVPLENGVVSDPPGYLPKVDCIDHRASVGELRSFFPGLRPQDLPDGEAWAIERIQLITHNVRIEVTDASGRSVFGAIEQVIEPLR